MLAMLYPQVCVTSSGSQVGLWPPQWLQDFLRQHRFVNKKNDTLKGKEKIAPCKSAKATYWLLETIAYLMVMPNKMIKLYRLLPEEWPDWVWPTPPPRQRFSEWIRLWFHLSVVQHGSFSIGWLILALLFSFLKWLHWRFSLLVEFSPPSNLSRKHA